MTWRDDAACRGQTSVMFPATSGPLDYVEAKTICDTCPVTVECLQAGIDEPYGMWGGMTPAEREQLRGRPFPRRAQILIRIEGRCVRCQEVFDAHRNRKYCDDCRVIASKEKERERRRIARPKQQTAHNVPTGGQRP